MATDYSTREGDTIDSICWSYYGRTSGAVEAVVEANPLLSFEEAELSSGLTITLPDIEEPKTARVSLY